ncbi:MAG: GAF domain-containing protein [Gemmatimonadaceae bacterium]
MSSATSSSNVAGLDLPTADLFQVARKLAAAADSSNLAASALADCVLQLASAEGCLVACVEGGVLRVDGAAGTLAPFGGQRFPVVESIASLAMRERRVLVQNDPSPTAAPLFERIGIRQIAAAPLEGAGVAFGVIVVANSTRGAFSDADALKLRRVADLGSLAVRNARLLERERQSTREARALAEIVQHLNQSLELERIFTLIAEHAADLLGAAGATVTMVEGDVLRIVGAAGHAVGRFKGDLPKDTVFSGEALRRRRAVRTTDLRLFPQWQHSADLLRECAPNAIAAPLLVGDRAIGTVLVYGNPRRDFDEHEEELLQALASHAAVAVENARLYRAAARTARHAEILAATGRTLASVVSADTVFEGISQVATKLLGVSGLTVYTLDVERRSSSISYSWGLGAHSVESYEHAVWHGAPAQAIRSRECVIIDDLGALKSSEPGLDNLLSALRSEGVVVIACLPLIFDDTVRGLLVLRWSTRRHLDPAERELYTDFATHAAVALRNAGLLGDLQRRAARLAAVAKVQQAISRTQLSDVYGEVHRAVLSSISGVPVFAILLSDDKEMLFRPQLIVVEGVSTSASALSPVAVDDCSASRALRDRVAVRDGAPRRAWSDAVAGISARAPLRSEIAVPLLHGEVVLGALVVQSYSERAFDDDDEAILALIARQAGAAIDNARLFHAERRARSVAEAAARIAQAALGSHTVSETAEEVLSALELVAPSAGKALALTSDEGQSLRYVAATGALAPLRNLVVPQVESAVRLLGGRGESVTPLPALLASVREGSVALAGATILPLIAKDEVLGVLWTLPVLRARDHADDDGTLQRLASYVALAADVLRLSEEERKRRERERMLATALATMDQPVFILGLDRRIWYANAASMREYGHSVDELTNLAFDSLVESAVPARRIGNTTESAPSSVWMAEHVHRRRDGTHFPASVMLSYIRDDAGAPVGQVMNVRNLTDERRREEQLRQSEKLVALGELVAGVAHELNNPLAGISAFAELLLEEALAEDQRDSVRLIKREADRAVGVIRDLLLFSRKTAPSNAPVDLNEVIRLTLRLRSFSLRSVGIELELDLSESIPKVIGDDQRLQQVLLNLVVNAEYALQRAERKHLAITTEAVNGGVLISLTDSGAGMTNETRQRIFEPFFTTKPAGQGTGLGLSVSYGIVQAHGGSISVESQPGVGSVFRISLPATGTTALALTNTA